MSRLVGTAGLVTIVVLACTANQAAPTPDVVTEDRAVIEGFNDAMNRLDFNAALEFVGDEVAFGDDYTRSDADAIRRALMTYRNYFDCTIEIDRIESVAGSPGTYEVTTRLAEREGGSCPSVGELNDRVLRVEGGRIVQLP